MELLHGAWLYFYKLWSTWASDSLANNPAVFLQLEASQVFYSLIVSFYTSASNKNLCLQAPAGNQEWLFRLWVLVMVGVVGGWVSYWYWQRAQFDSFNMYNGLHPALRMVCFKTETLR